MELYIKVVDLIPLNKKEQLRGDVNILEVARTFKISRFFVK